MLSVRKEIYAESAVSPHGKPRVRAEIDVDTADELPEADDISGRILHQGSTALIIREGRIAILSGDGKWYDTNGNTVKE